MKKQLIRLVILGLAGMMCQKQDNVPKDAILAKIGDKTITRSEFIRRSEYTIRPAYCSLGDNIIHKKIILNSLIAEKLMALEAEKRDLLEDNDNFQAYIKGRREQAMRKLLYNEKAYNKVTLTDDELSDLFKVAGRKYKIQYFNMADSAAASEMKEMLNADPEQFAQIFKKYHNGKEVPEREVALTDYEVPQVEDALFTRPVEDGTVIGPLRIDDNLYLFMRINGWKDTRVIAEGDVRKRWDRVRERLTIRKAASLWDAYVVDIMKGKHLKFQEQTFYQLADIFADAYQFSEKERREMFNDQFWDRSNNNDFDRIADAMSREAALQTAPLFSIDGRTYTVREFRSMLASHPLVFRKRKFSKAEFPKQFKLAIADLVRDQYVNKEAYKAHLDRNPRVKQTEIMWHDAITGMAQRNTYLDSIGKKDAFIGNYMNVLHEDLNPYVRSLQKKYSDMIEINADLLKNITLTRIDMFALQKSEAYPIVVPQFPVMTDEHLMDYGRDLSPKP